MIPGHSTLTKCFYPVKNLQVRLRSTEIQPTSIAELGGTNVEHNENLTSQGIQHRATRMVSQPDINPAQQDLTPVIKWKPAFSLGQAV